MNKVEIITVYYDCDEEFRGDELFVTLFINGEFITEGDYYHNKIQDYIAGYLDGQRDAGVALSPTIKTQLTQSGWNARFPNDQRNY
jgi:hypothetical protein